MGGDQAVEGKKISTILTAMEQVTIVRPATVPIGQASDQGTGRTPEAIQWSRPIGSEEGRHTKDEDAKRHDC